MCWLEDWKTLQSFGNQAFRRRQLDLARHYYLHSILQLKSCMSAKLLPLAQAEAVADNLVATKQSAALVQLLICLSISIQNLAETYQHQRRWQRCQMLLRQAQQRLQQLQLTLPETHPAQLILLQESCRLRHEQCRHALDCHRCLQHSSAVLFEMASTAIH